MKIKKFNENKIDEKEFEEIALEALTYITDDFNDFTYDIWEKPYNFSICITFNFKYSEKPLEFNDQVNQVQDPKNNYEVFEEKSRFWKAATMTKSHLESTFNQVQFTGKDLFDSRYMMTIKCKRK